MNFKSINPKNGKVIREAVPFFRKKQLDDAISKSYVSFQNYKETELTERIEKLGNVRKELEGRLDTYTKLIADEMGKPILQGEAEIKKCMTYCKYYEDNLEKFLKPQMVDTEADKSYYELQPLGPLLSISPWNFPFFMPIKSCIPQLALGNTILHKPAPNTSLCGEAVQETLARAGFKNDEFQLVYLNPEDTEYVVSNPHIQGVAFTGSTRGGREISSIAGKHLKKCVLELGGSDPFLVLEDADVRFAAEKGFMSRCLNNGQACINAKRFIVHEKHYDQFKELIMKDLDTMEIGDPLEAQVGLGPLARLDLYKNLRDQVEGAIDAGAHVTYGDMNQILKAPDPLKGLYFRPVVLENIDRDNPVYHQELFGPVFSLYKVSSDQEAVNLGKYSLFSYTQTKY